MNNRFAAEKFAWNACCTGGNFPLAGGLRGEAEEVGSGDTGWENTFALRRKPLDGNGAGSALAKSRLSGAVVNALAQALKCALAGEARQGLGDSSECKVLEVLRPPKAFTFRLDAAANDGHDAMVSPCFCWVSFHEKSMALGRACVKFFC